MTDQNVTEVTSDLPIVVTAKEAYRFFETARRATGDTATGPREDGERYTRLKDGAPEWVTEMVREAHRSGETLMLPDDIRYEMIREAVGYIVDCGNDGDLDDLESTFADEGSVYTADQLAWLASRIDRYAYCDEWAEEYDYQGEDPQMSRDSHPSVLALIRGGIYMERREVFASVRRSLDDATGLTAADAEGTEEE